MNFNLKYSDSTSSSCISILKVYLFSIRHRGLYKCGRADVPRLSSMMLDCSNDHSIERHSKSALRSLLVIRGAFQLAARLSVRMPDHATNPDRFVTDVVPCTPQNPIHCTRDLSLFKFKYLRNGHDLLFFYLNSHVKGENYAKQRPIAFEGLCYTDILQRET